MVLTKSQFKFDVNFARPLTLEWVCIASARVRDIIARVVSSWRWWRKNSLQLDFDRISFSSH